MRRLIAIPSLSCPHRAIPPPLPPLPPSHPYRDEVFISSTRRHDVCSLRYSLIDSGLASKLGLSLDGEWWQAGLGLVGFGVSMRAARGCCCNCALCNCVISW